RDLAVDDFLRPLELGILMRSPLEHHRSAGDRRQGIPQFVCERRQEMILAAIRLFQPSSRGLERGRSLVDALLQLEVQPFELLRLAIQLRKYAYLGAQDLR